MNLIARVRNRIHKYLEYKRVVSSLDIWKMGPSPYFYPRCFKCEEIIKDFKDQIYGDSQINRNNLISNAPFWFHLNCAPKNKVKIAKFARLLEK